MKTEQEIAEIVRHVKRGPRFESLLLQRRSHAGSRELRVMVRYETQNSLTAICSWCLDGEVNVHELYDQVFDVMFECTNMMLGKQGVLF